MGAYFSKADGTAFGIREPDEQALKMYMVSTITLLKDYRHPSHPIACLLFRNTMERRLGVIEKVMKARDADPRDIFAVTRTLRAQIFALDVSTAIVNELEPNGGIRGLEHSPVNSQEEHPSFYTASGVEIPLPGFAAIYAQQHEYDPNVHGQDDNYTPGAVVMLSYASDDDAYHEDIQALHAWDPTFYDRGVEATPKQRADAWIEFKNDVKAEWEAMNPGGDWKEDHDEAEEEAEEEARADQTKGSPGVVIEEITEEDSDDERCDGDRTIHESIQFVHRLLEEGLQKRVPDADRDVTAVMLQAYLEGEGRAQLFSLALSAYKLFEARDSLLM
ncbi:uncharacterized protein J4E88_000104 [Alternaria novae-zelandiae]|uniref:uncharacterized protein n=1 Tax=Alternaria novae-zelandiae TaxID=430562 RepID=UPI0020C526F4|nr:uncharacterized protein J4E88_000104 [Alternaria novae-zelandiae]KAI4695934.1 hypothetical protein J4E88_000104 [Alternaria novae-zelandiae]